VAEKETIRTARKLHRCDDQRDGCSGRIWHGERYREYVIYPGHDFIAVDKPTVMRQCGACAANMGDPIEVSS
jgi:hypothetical protein